MSSLRMLVEELRDHLILEEKDSLILHIKHKIDAKKTGQNEFITQAVALSTRARQVEREAKKLQHPDRFKSIAGAHEQAAHSIMAAAEQEKEQGREHSYQSLLNLAKYHADKKKYHELAP